MKKYLAEFVGTLILVFVAAQFGHPLGVGLGLGIALWITTQVLGALAGAVVDPTAGFGLSAVVGELFNHWIYLVGPALGGVLAALLQRTFVANTAVAEA